MNNEDECASCMKQLTVLKNTLESTLNICNGAGSENVEKRARSEKADAEAKATAERRDQEEQNDGINKAVTSTESVSFDESVTNSKLTSQFSQKLNEVEKSFTFAYNNDVLQMWVQDSMIDEIRRSLELFINHSNFRLLTSGTPAYDDYLLVTGNSILKADNKNNSYLEITKELLANMMYVFPTNLFTIVSTNFWLNYVQSFMKGIRNSINNISKRRALSQALPMSVPSPTSTSTGLSRALPTAASTQQRPAAALTRKNATKFFVDNTITKPAWARFYSLFIIIMNVISKLLDGHTRTNNLGGRRTRTKKRVRRTKPKQSRKQTKSLL